MFAVSRIARLIGIAAMTAIAGAASVAKQVFAPKTNEPQEPKLRGSSNRRTKQGFGNAPLRRCTRKRKNQQRHKVHCRRQRGDSLIEFLVAAAALAVVVAAAVGYYQSQATATYSYGANGMVETRCIDGSKWVLSRSGMAAQMLDKNGRAIACPLT